MRWHTPGTWYAVGAWVEVESDDIPDICTCYPADMGQEHLKRSDDEILANVRLIASAPNMLSALYFVHDYIRDLIEFSDDSEINKKQAEDIRILIVEAIVSATGIAEHAI